MKGIILAGGTGSRLYPLTKVTNKHLLPMGNKPMIIHAVEKMKSLDITDILIITGTEHMGSMISLLGSGKEYLCNFTFKVQDQADGIAGALLLAEDFVGNNSCLVILGDNIFEDNIKQHIDSWIVGNKECKVFLKKIKDPRRFGVPLFNASNEIIDIIEKPLVPPSDFCITGIYCYKSNVFSIIKNIKKSDRGEYEITDVNKAYIKRKSIDFSEIHGLWVDAGTLESYHIANSLLIK